MFPKINLAIDNCFAAKRWTEPEDWMRIVRGLGLLFVETSADNECDPLYHGTAYLKRWTDSVQKASKATGCTVANMYSGHGTYATLGLAHADKEIRRRFVDGWLKPIINVADVLGAGLGFFMHAFPVPVLDDPDAYRRAYETLISDLAEVAQYAGTRERLAPIGVEQMYSPHQVPWTVAGTRDLVSRVSERAGAPFYFSLDVGHQSGQHRYLRPDADRVAAALTEARSGPPRSVPLWLGSTRAHELFFDAVQRAGACSATVDAIVSDIEDHAYLFAEECDGDPYHWLEELVGWSPIVHLQQTDGKTSGHRPFTAEQNAAGIIKPERILQSIYRHYRRAESEAADVPMPPRVDTITLTLEMFSATADYPHAIVERLRETVAYWRRFVPKDGLTVDQLVGTRQ